MKFADSTTLETINIDETWHTAKSKRLTLLINMGRTANTAACKAICRRAYLQTATGWVLPIETMRTESKPGHFG